ncbi:hypothetical protein C0993_008296 [Termitomyces sp. T159_Od127]|nr:hypothetical protein C0993_008296 [Termitomyces sp. T159_Od127]
MKTDLAIKLIEKWSVGYVKMDCTEEKCYGVLAVHRICFALALLHFILSLSLIDVKDTRDKRASIQNGWWGPKVLLWLVLIVVSFFIPNGFFMFWGNYVALIGATIFILLGLVLLVDFAHSWSEMCLENWENSSSNFWQWVLILSTAGTYIFTFALTGVLYAYFAGGGCTLNQFFISFNLALCILITVLCVHPTIQEYNPRSGLAQAGVVGAYCTYLIVSALSNHTHDTLQCNPLRDGKSTRKAVVIFGGIFTFLAIAFSTTRAATQSRALVGKGRKNRVELTDEENGHSELGQVTTTQPGRTESPRYQALLAAVNAGDSAIPASALEEEDDEDEGDVVGESRDDERSGTRYNYSWFHIIFAIAAMYVAMLLTDWNVVSKHPIAGSADPDSDVYIGRSEVAMWMRVVSSWVCMFLYMWSLLAPIIMPDRIEKGMEWGREEEKETVKSNVMQFAGRVQLKDGRKGRIIYFRADVGGKIGHKLTSLLETINLTLSSPPLTPDILRDSKAYLFLLPSTTSPAREKIIGCVIAQRIETAMAIATPKECEVTNQSFSDTAPSLIAVDPSSGFFCHPKPLPTPLGISRLFVPATQRRQGVARLLLSAAAETFVHGCSLDPKKGQVAFTQPTGDGKAVMMGWGGGGVRIYQE